MKAAVLPAAGAPVRVEEVRDPLPKVGEVLVKVAACGVCHSDLHIARGDLKFVTPCVLGHEISGTVAALGEGVSGLAPGQRVVSSFIMPCGRCPPCARGRDDLCETYFATNRTKGTLLDGATRLFRPDGTPLWMQMMGGMAEYAVVPATDVFPLPPSVPFEEASILGCALMTAYGAVKNAGAVSPGQTVAVVGAGGVGSNVVALARLFGAGAVVAVDVRDEKLEAARALGATEVVNSRKEDPVERVNALTGGRGADVAIEALGLPQTIVQAFGMTRAGGRTVLVGVAPSQATVALEINRIVRRGIQIVGSFGCRVRTDMPELVRLAAEGRIDPAASITRRYRLDQVQEAFEAMERGEIVGRAIVVLSR
jgi:S-(hydroxymethyl)glutathione dehydrogenase/alcohol dehydrogenase